MESKHREIAEIRVLYGISGGPSQGIKSEKLQPKVKTYTRQDAGFEHIQHRQEQIQPIHLISG